MPEQRYLDRIAELRGGKRHLSYSMIKHAMNDLALFDLHIRGKFVYSSDALDFGNLYDCMLLTPELIDDQFAFFDTDTAKRKVVALAEEEGKEVKQPSSTKKYKELLAEFEEENKGKIIVTEDDYKKAEYMVMRMQNSGVMDQYLNTAVGTVQEEKYVEYGGLLFRMFYDYNCPSHLTDSKTTRGLKGFKYDAQGLCYDIQAFLYSYAEGGKDFYWAVQEKNGSYPINVIKASQATLDRGKEKLEYAIKRTKKYLDNPAPLEAAKDYKYYEL